MSNNERQSAEYYEIHVGDNGNTAKIRLGADDAVTACHGVVGAPWIY